MAYATCIATRSEALEDLEKLEGIARSTAAALMCCGRLPWRCRRKILADHFAARASERSMDSRVESEPSARHAALPFNSFPVVS